MPLFSSGVLVSFQATATSCANYLDACDAGQIPLNADRYRAYAQLLVKIFALIDPYHHFPGLLRQSPAAREIAETQQVTHRLQTDRKGIYPELSEILQRVSA